MVSGYVMTKREQKPLLTRDEKRRRVEKEPRHKKQAPAPRSEENKFECVNCDQTTFHRIGIDSKRKRKRKCGDCGYVQEMAPVAPPPSFPVPELIPPPWHEVKLREDAARARAAPVTHSLLRPQENESRFLGKEKNK